jgi:predicted amidophosphoribosyltransferase
VVGGRLRLIPAFLHTGPAVSMVHNLKYRGIPGYPGLVAEQLADRVPRLPIVPIPRALSRRLVYGVDPALQLATELGRTIGVPVLSLLRAPVHTRRRAGGDHARPVEGYALRSRPPPSVVLLDDVVTTGRTLWAAAASIGWESVRVGVSANVVPTVSSLLAPEPDPTFQWPQS